MIYKIKISNGVNTDFKAKSTKTLKYLGKKLLRGLIYLFRFYLKIKEKLAFGQSLFVLIVLFLIISISWEVRTISGSSFKNSLLSKITASEALIVVTPESESAPPADRPDFAIASIHKSEPIKTEMIPLSLGASSLITPEIEFEGTEPLTRTEAEKYIIQPGDTISSIAEKFGINISSILWENNLTLRSVLQPGRELIILPVSGLKHKVSKGENLSQIAKKYKANIDDIIEFNGLADADDLQVGDALMIPYGQKPAPPPAPKPIIVKLQENVELVKASPDYFSWLKKTACHRFAYGHCTSWVAFKLASSIGKCIPWTGNAKNWIGNAKKAGYAIGSEPKIGAIVSLNGASRGCYGRSWYCWGHVAYVESFDANNVTFSEMNHLGRYKVSRRTLPLNDKTIIGYIYP